MSITDYGDRDMLAINVANVIAGELEGALFTHEFVSLALPGGTTPGPIYDVLCGAKLAWDRVHILLTDERWVEETSPLSNAGLLRRRLLTERAAAATFTPYFRPGVSASDAAPEVSAAIDRFMPLSVLVLGMGEDMHTASLFPGADGLKAALAPDAPHLCPISVPGQDHERLTLSAAALDGAMAKHLVIYGDKKRAAVERAMTLGPEEAPISTVLHQATIHWAA